MSDVCIKCADKHKDYRSESGHLAMDPKTGATILEPHGEPQQVINAEQDLAVLYRRTADVARRIAFIGMVERSILRPSDRGNATLYHRQNTFVPRAAYFTPSWLPEARAAFYGLAR